MIQNITQSQKDKNQGFVKACEKVNLPTTRRQFSKWLRKTGLAWKEGR